MHAGSPGRRWFYACLAAILLVIVAVGFEQSFYLRNVLHAGLARRSILPVYLVAHGIALTLWFLLFLAQTLLASFGRVRFHRSLGITGAALAAVVFALSMLVVVRSVVRETSLVVIGDIALLILFAILVTASIRFRRQPQVHKRLMAIASISIVAPAIARWPRAQSMLPISVVLPQLLLYAAQVIYDVRSSRRLHSATVWGVVGYVVAVGITIPLASSKLGHAFVNALKSRHLARARRARTSQRQLIASAQ
jgi:hypothetical protein